MNYYEMFKAVTKQQVIPLLVELNLKRLIKVAF